MTTLTMRYNHKSTV